jgi:heme A synthase
MKLDLKLFHKIAWINLLLIYVMVLLGAYVKNSGSSLACPDWPLCHGQFLPEMVGGVAIEHSHRLLGSFLGLLTLSLFFIAFKNRSDI